MIDLRLGDCLEVMKTIESNSVDSIVTDPPYELGFMGKSWDNTGIANNVDMWKEALRVLKPGGHLLSFSGTRTYHRQACAIEDAGFEIRDMIEWVYGSGFPKSLNIGKAVDKIQRNDREKHLRTDGKGSDSGSGCYQMNNGKSTMTKEFIDTKGTSEWEGWGTALKPAHEPICMARKPLAEKTVAENCLKYGTGGINIDESRVAFVNEEDRKESTTKNQHADFGTKPMTNNNVYGDYSMIQPKNFNPTGRFPANLIHDNSEEVRECFPETKATKPHGGDGGKLDTQEMGWGFKRMPCELSDNGGNASRFFKSIIYQAKASKGERNKGCEELEYKFRAGLAGADRDTDDPLDDVSERFRTQPAKNNHPTVKPVALMEYLITMVTPKDGTVLDPFMGSGSTGVACKNLNRNFMGIELNEEYLEIAKNRIENI